VCSSDLGCGARISGSLAQTEKSAAQVLSLPMYPELTDQEVSITIDAILAWDKANR
jgi:dTDP-4-amino-4,6-dideoxygalactose transaminase